MSEPVGGQWAPPSVAEPTTELSRDADWRRLDRRMLLVHPVTELFRFLPFLIGIFVLGSSSDGGGPWQLIGVAVPIAIGLFRYASTTFRITPGQIELRRGIVGRRVLSAPLDRVRTVELTASPIHRVLRLEKVQVGTGSAASAGDEGLVLDSLGSAEAQRLRRELLDRAAGPGEAATESTDSADLGGTALVTFDPGWARFAPLTTSGLLVSLAAIGAVLGPALGNGLEVRVTESEAVERLADIALPLAIGVGVIALLVLAAVLAVIGYLLGNWGFTLTRDDVRRTFRVRRGALTTRETSVDMDRLRGAEVHEPLGLRIAGGERLEAVLTGLKRQAEGNSAPLVPAAPAEVVRDVLVRVLDPSVGAGLPFRQHGAAARRRRYFRAVGPGVLLVAALAGVAAFADLPWWGVGIALVVPVLGVPLARDRYARLGHALTPTYLVVRQGTFSGRRDALQRTGIIGWNLSQTWFQRRAGVVTLTATTAAGRQAYVALDVPEEVGVALADEAVPELVGQFLA